MFAKNTAKLAVFFAFIFKVFKELSRSEPPLPLPLVPLET